MQDVIFLDSCITIYLLLPYLPQIVLAANITHTVRDLLRTNFPFSFIDF